MALQILLSILVVGAVLAVLAYPIVKGVNEPAADAARAELEDAKQAKYREIRDAELDLRAGKLTDEEWQETDRDLRREAMAILAKIDEGKPAASGAKSTAKSDGDLTPG
jgi:flagellar biosynthesis/type III secretory pathway M-ring protein FliF/YscJ